MRNRQFDTHVRARAALAKKVVSRRLEWSWGADRLHKLGRDKLIRIAYGAIAKHTWRPGWGDKLTAYQPFGPAQAVIGTYRDVPSAEIHQIMCRMVTR